MFSRNNVPSLVDLCVNTAIDNLRYLGDVGGIDLHLLERILPHCTHEELRHVENCTERDLSSITDKLWKKFYENQFTAANTNLVIERMKRRGVVFKWRQLFEAKLKDVAEAENKAANRLKQLYQKEDARKQSRQIQMCSKVPPSSRKRSIFGGSVNVSNSKGRLMKKAKMEYLKSDEVKNLAAMKRSSLDSVSKYLDRGPDRGLQSQNRNRTETDGPVQFPVRVPVLPTPRSSVVKRKHSVMRFSDGTSSKRSTIVSRRF